MMSQEAKEEEISMPVDEMVATILEQPILAEHSFYYDNGFRAIGSFAIHGCFGNQVLVARR